MKPCLDGIGERWDGEREARLVVRLILCFLRHLSAESAMRRWRRAAVQGPYPRRGTGFVGARHPPSKFSEVFARARREGLITVAHAGEEGPPAYIVEALDDLRVSRIDHGVRCEEDPALSQRLARSRVPLTVCPLSNIRLAVFDRMEQHNLKRLLDSGLCVTVNSDDPAYFGGYVLENYLAVQQALGLTRADLRLLTRHAGLIGAHLPSRPRKRGRAEGRFAAASLGRTRSRSTIGTR